MALGESNPYKLAGEMPASLFNAWKYYYQIEPFGQWRDNFHAATIATLIANANRKKGANPLKIDDFMFRDKTAHEESEKHKAIAAMHSMKAHFKALKENRKNG